MKSKKSERLAELSGRPAEVITVLQEQPHTRKEYFKNYWAAHKRILVVAQDLLRVIYEPADAEVIYLLGPTGVGKTTVMKYVIAELYKKALPELDNLPGHIPAASIQAENPDKGSYDWKDHYISTLLSLNEVLIDRKICLPEPDASRGELKVYPRNGMGGRAALRHAAQNALSNRIMYAFFVDEAQYITKRKSGDGLMNQADTIRSIASQSGILHVLVGTYDLRHLRNLNGQLGRRSHTVHFRRYKIDNLSNEDQIKELQFFTEAFKDFQEHLPVAEQPDLVKHLEFCFTRCLGCVGRLKSWFRQSLAIAIEDNCRTVSSKIFLKAAPSKEVWKQIAQEIKDGEDALEEDDDELEAELSKLNHKAERTSSVSTSQAADSEESRVDARKKDAESLPKVNKGRRPFLPKPERYSVGVKKNVE